MKEDKSILGKHEFFKANVVITTSTARRGKFWYWSETVKLAVTKDQVESDFLCLARGSILDMM